jgi:hypothetical protein
MVGMHLIPGWTELVELVGAEPAFADAPILSLSITLSGEASLTIRTYAMPDGARYDYEKPIVIDIKMRCLEAVELDAFISTSVLDELKIDYDGSAWAVSLEPACGLGGKLRAREVTIHSRPG